MSSNEKYLESSATKRKLYLAPDQFENFLNREQRDPGLNELLYPFYNTDKAAEMILKFETDENFKSKSRILLLIWSHTWSYIIGISKSNCHHKD